MRKFIFFLSLPLFFFAKDFSVGSYNVENLFDLKYDKTEYKEFIPNKTNWNDKNFQIKLQNVAQVVNDLNVDIIALQEIESQNVLEKLQEKLSQYPYVSFVKNPNSAVGLGVLSKFKIIKSDKIEIVSNESIERPIQEVLIEIEQGKNLTLFNNHWRSKKAKESKRVQYALSLKNRLNSLGKEEDYIILGDFNSNYDEYLTLSLDKNLNDTYSNTGINQVLNTTIDKSYVTKESLSQYKKMVNYNLWLEIPYEDRFSYIYKRNNATPDNIILPPALFDEVNISYKDNSFEVFKPNYLIKNRKINRWQMSKNHHRGKGYSDHLPIKAQFSTQAYKQTATKPLQINTIESLYKIDKLENPSIIKDVVVIYKNNESAILKAKNDRAIYVYRSAKNLQLGKVYDIEVYKVKRHFGLKEITQLRALKVYKQTQDVKNYFLDANDIDLFDKKYQNEIITNLSGVYKDGFLVFGDSKIKLFSKNKELLPKNGQKITIVSAHLGTFKQQAQLIIYKKSDYYVN